MRVGLIYNPQNHHRRSIRLKGYDYTRQGAYFVTLVAYHRDEIFGEVVNGVVRLSALGQIVREEWLRSIGIRKEIRLNEDEFVVMPNHVHGIVWIVEDGGDSATGVGAHGVRPGGDGDDSVEAHGMRLDDGVRQDGVGTNEGMDAWLGTRADTIRPYGGVDATGVGAHGMRPEDGTRQEKRIPSRAPNSLGSFIAGFKSSVTHRAKVELNMEGIWQRNYFDHIIRNQEDFQAIWNYIDANPQKWEQDQLHPQAAPNRYNQEK